MADDEKIGWLGVAIFIIVVIIAAWYIMSSDHGCEFCV
jgi:hypothetical protein